MGKITYQPTLLVLKDVSLRKTSLASLDTDTSYNKFAMMTITSVLYLFLVQWFLFKTLLEYFWCEYDTTVNEVFKV